LSLLWPSTLTLRGSSTLRRLRASTLALLRPPVGGSGRRTLAGPSVLSALPALSTLAAAAAPSAATPAPALALGLWRVDPAVLQVPERDDDLGPRRVVADELDDPGPERARRIRRHHGETLRVEQHHPRPGDALAHAAGPLHVHDEEVSLVVEHVLAVLELGQRLAAELLEDGEMLLAALEGLLHRDDPVPEHAGLAHGRS